MRRGYFGCGVLFDADGEIFALSTGSEACAEHEQGSQHMQDALCGGDVASNKFLRFLGFKHSTVPAKDTELIRLLQRGGSVKFPSILARKHINKNLDKIQFITGTDEQGAVAVWGYTPTGLRPDVLHHQELQFSALCDKKKLVSGAWDEYSFAIKVCSAELVAKLQRFAEKIQNGEGVFAGLFLNEKVPGSNVESMSGVIIAVRSGLTDKHFDAIHKAQHAWEDSLKLKAYSKETALYALVQDGKRHTRLPGFIWPVWEKPDEPEKTGNSVILYMVNPDTNVDVCRGPPTF